MRSFFSDWRNALPIAGLGVVALTGLYYFLRPKREDAGALERERRTYLNRVGRIVEGQVLDVVDGSENGNGAQSHDSSSAAADTAPASDSALPSSDPNTSVA